MLSLVASFVVAALPMPGEAETKRFDEAFSRAEELYSRGDYGAAISLFRVADRQKVTSEVAYDLARSYEKLGDLAFTTLYDRLSVARGPEATDAPDILNRVQRTLDRAEDEGQGLLEVTSPATRLTIAGRTFPLAPVALFLPAGEYVVEGQFPSGLASAIVKVRAGRVTTLFFDPVKPPLVSADTSAPSAAVTDKPVASVEQGTRVPMTRVASFIAMGLGAAALGTALALGSIASSEAARTQDKALTVREARALAAESNGKAGVANFLFGAAGVATAAGGVLFVVSLPSPGEPKAEAAK